MLFMKKNQNSEKNRNIQMIIKLAHTEFSGLVIYSLSITYLHYFSV